MFVLFFCVMFFDLCITASWWIQDGYHDLDFWKIHQPDHICWKNCWLYKLYKLYIVVAAIQIFHDISVSVDMCWLGTTAVPWIAALHQPGWIRPVFPRRSVMRAMRPAQKISRAWPDSARRNGWIEARTSGDPNKKEHGKNCNCEDVTRNHVFLESIFG